MDLGQDIFHGTDAEFDFDFLIVLVHPDHSPFGDPVCSGNLLLI